MHTSVYGSVYFCKTIRCIFERRNWFKRRRPSVSIISHSARVDYVRCMKPIRNYLKIAYKDLWEQSAREFGDGARTARFFFRFFSICLGKVNKSTSFPFSCQSHAQLQLRLSFSQKTYSASPTPLKQNTDSVFASVVLVFSFG